MPQLDIEQIAKFDLHSELDQELLCEPPLCLQGQSSSLHNAFGTAFSFWRNSEAGWQEIRLNGKPLDNQHATIIWNAFDLVANQNSATVYRCGTECCAILVPVIVNFETVVALAIVETSDVNLLNRLGRLWIESAQVTDQNRELEDENSGFVRQVTEDLEELTFLRQISEHLELAEANDGVAGLTKNILLLLNCSVKAEQILMLTQDSPAAAFSKIGNSIVSKSNLKAIINRYADAAGSQPMILNSVDDGIPELEGINSLILCKVSKADRVLGWVLAVNRVQENSDDFQQETWNRINGEFGTNEASLLGAAAGMLATQMLNVELFYDKEKLLTSVVRSLVSAIEAKDRYTRGHSERVALYGCKLAELIGFEQPEQERIYLSGLLHDIGKIGISDQTLGKTEKLTNQEFDEVKRHPDEGWQILHELDHLSSIMEGVLYHHERIDGKGYPDGLAGDSIPVDGRILAIADAFDAMTSDRPYRVGMPVEKAAAILQDGAGTQWDSEMISAFLGSLDEIVSIKDSYQTIAPVSRQTLNCDVSPAK